MKKPKILVLLVLVFSLVPAAGGEFSDYYGNASDSFNDPNTGLTAFPLLEIPLSARAASMGSAYTAVFLDAGALLANPASSAFLPLTQLSVSHNNWIADSSIEAAVFTRRFGNWGAGIAAQVLHLPFTAYDSFAESTAATHIPEAVLALNISRKFFDNYYFKGISLGINLKGAVRLVSAALYKDQTVFSVMADIGLATQFDFLKFYTSREKNFSLGLAVKNLGPAAKGDPLPAMATVGIGYSPWRPVLLSFDFNYPFTLDPDVNAKKWYWGAGANVNVTDFLSIQTGFTYPGANPRFSLGSSLDLEEMSFLLNYTLDLTTQLKAADRFTLEARFNMGDEGRADLQREVDQYYIEGLGAYAQGDLRRAVQYWQACLLLNPNFKPAREYMIMVQETLDLYTRLEDINRLR